VTLIRPASTTGGGTLCGGAASSGIFCEDCQARPLKWENEVCLRWLLLRRCEAVVPSLCPQAVDRGIVNDFVEATARIKCNP
jgi:hypothetical protein